MHEGREQAQIQPPRTSDPGTTLTSSSWHLDPARSVIEFEVPHYWGLRTVKGRFTSYAGRLDLRSQPAIELTIEAASLTTGSARRDRHLRSPDFFDVDRHPYVRFVSDLARLRGDTLVVRGELAAGAGRLDLDLEAVVTLTDGDAEIAAEAFVMHSWLGMTWSPFGITRPYSRLIVAGHLTAQSEATPAHSQQNSPQARLRARCSRGAGLPIPSRRCQSR